MPLLWVSLAFLAGVFLGKTLVVPWYVWVILAFLFLAFVFFEKACLKDNSRWARFRKFVPLPPGIVLLFVVLGALRFILSIPGFSINDLAYYNDSGTYTVTARVSAPVDRREDAVYLEMEAVEIENPLETDPTAAIIPVSGKARVRFAPNTYWEYGDLLRFSAELLTPSDESDFSYKDFLSNEGIYTAIYYPQHVKQVGRAQVNPILLRLEKWRQAARKTIFRQYPQPESGLLSGILLGLDKDLPVTLKEDYQSTGTAHIIAISGFNMTVVAGAILIFASRLLNRYQAAILTSLVLGFYALFVGGSPSVVRAAVMAVAAFGGHLIGRRQMGLNALGFTASLMCLFNPQLPWDVSFQLSFAATLGLVIFGSPLQDWASGLMAKLLPEEQAARFSRPVSEFFLFTIAAQVTTLPIIAIAFGRISLSALLANPLILPVQPPLLVLGGISTLTGMVSPAAGKLVSLLVWPLLAYTNRVTESLAKIKGSSLAIHPQTAIWILIFLLVFLLLFVFRNYFKKLFKGHYIWFLLVLALPTVVVWSIIFHRPDGNMHLELIRSEDESTLFMRLPDGQTLLFDPGRNVNELSAAISRELSPWNFDVDEVWLTNRSDTRNLEPLNERIPINQVVLSPPAYQAGADQYPVQIPEDMRLKKLTRKNPVIYDSGLQVEVVAVDTNSAALYITYKEIRILIPNGVDYALIRDIAPEVLQGLTILILKDEDISYIPPRVWSTLQPQIILWNSTSLSPDPAWMGTDVFNRVELVSDGASFSIKTE